MHDAASEKTQVPGCLPRTLANALPGSTTRSLFAVCLTALLAAACADVDPSGPLDRFGRQIGAPDERLREPPASQIASRTLGATTSALFDQPSLTNPGSAADAVAIGDVTGDGRADVVLTTTSYFDPDNDYQVFVYAQQEDGSLAAPTRVPYQAAANRTGIVLADLDGRGASEIVVGHAQGITVLRADGAGGFVGVRWTAARSADTLSALDIDLDGHLDIVALSWSSGATVFYGDGEGGIRAQAALQTNAAGSNDQAAADLNGDGNADLAVMSGQSYATPNLSVHLQSGGGDLASPVTYRVAERETTSGLGVGDVDGDGLTDIVLSRARNSPTHLWILLQQPDGTLSAPTTISSYDVPGTVETADINIDGRDDVLVLHGGWQALGVYLQGDTGLLAEQLVSIPYASRYSPQGLAVGDIDGDGCPDVAIADYTHGLVTLRGQSCTPPPAPLSNITATASSSYSSYYGPSNVLDGQRYTFWVGARGASNRPWTLTFDVGEARLDRIELDWYYRYGATDFAVELSADGGQSYAEVASDLAAPPATSSPYISTTTVGLEGQIATHLRVVVNAAPYRFPVVSEARLIGWPTVQGGATE